MKLSLQEITARLHAMSSEHDLTALYAEITQADLSEAERELLKRCAAVRAIDAPLMDAVLRDGVAEGDADSVPFDRLMENDAIEPLAGTPGMYRVRDDLREALFEQWLTEEPGGATLDRASIPPPLAAFSLRLADYYRGLGTMAELDCLYHLIAASPDEAETMFRRLYAEADVAFRLGRCSDLIHILEQRRNLLSSGLDMLCKDCVVYRQTRGFWTEEYDRTTHYYRRETLETAFISLLATRKLSVPQMTWVLYLHAPGGMGKSSFIRWLIARYCVLEPNRIPCALIDFDKEAHFKITQYPWMLLYRLVEQFNIQMPNAPFVELLQELRDHHNIVDQQEKSGTGGTSLTWQSVLPRFVDTLHDAHLTQPLVIVLDTLEQVLMRPPANLAAVLEPLIALHAMYPNFVLILSGRNDIREKAREVDALLGLGTQDLTVTPFTPAEARAYLTEKRGLPTGETLEAVIASADSLPLDKATGMGAEAPAGANPFKLTLFAEILRSNPALTAEDIRDYGKDVDVAYLIERVVERIDNPQVRWLLRYGVVPRRLTFGFVETIMVPHLREAMSGRSVHDDPRQDNVPVQKRGKFPIDALSSPADLIDLHALWDILNRYAGQYSWVWPDAVDTSALAFHPDVVNPMRRLLQAQNVFSLLHRDAAVYYERLAETDGAQRDRWMREAIYHHFQGEGKGAEDFWRKQVEAARQSGQTDSLRSLLREVVGPEYVDGAGQPRTRQDGSSLISLETLIEANYLLTQSWLDHAAFAAAPNDARDWNEARNAFDRATGLEPQGKTKAISSVEKARLHATLLLREGDAGAAKKVIKAALGVTSSWAPILSGVSAVAGLVSPWLGSIMPPAKGASTLLSDQSAALPLLAVYAAAYARESDSIKAIFINEMIEMLAGPSQHVLVNAVREQLTHLYTLTEQYAKARTMSEKTTDIISLSSDLSARNELRRQVELHLKVGEWDAARSLAEGMLPSTWGETEVDVLTENVRCFLVAGRVRVAYHEPGTALTWMHAMNVLLSERANTLPAAQYHALSGDVLETWGRAFAQQKAYGESVKALEQARTHYQAIGDSYGGARCLLYLLRLYLQEVADFGRFADFWQQAERILRAGTPFSAPTPDEIETELGLALLEVEWLWRNEKTAEALVRVDILLATPRIQRSPRLTALAALWGVIALAADSSDKHISPAADPDHYFALLLAALEGVGNPVACLALLEDLRFCPILSGTSALLRRQLQERIESDIEVLPFPLALTTIEVCRVCGERDRARSFLAMILDRVETSAEKTILFPALVLWDRLNPTKEGTVLPEWAAPERLYTHLSEFPTLYGVALVIVATRALNGQDDAVGKMTLLTIMDDAEKALQQEKIVNQGQARAYAQRFVAEMRRARYGEAHLAIQSARQVAQSLKNPQLVAWIEYEITAQADDPSVMKQAERDAAVEQSAPDVVFPSTDITSDVMFRAEWTLPDAVTSACTLPGQPAEKLLVTSAENPLVAALYAHDADRVISYTLIRCVRENLKYSQNALPHLLSLKEHLTEAVKTTRGTTRAPDVRLDMRGDQLSAIPWEMLARLAQGEDGKVMLAGGRYLYRGGAQEPYASVQRPSDGRTPGVLVLQPGAAQRKSQMRGYNERDTVENMYRNRKMRVETLTDPGAEAIQQAMAAQRPSIVHLVATLKESPSIGIYLDFARDIEEASEERASKEALPDQSGAPGIFSASLLSWLIQNNEPGSCALVILDVLTPPGETEQVRQLLLRNAFAATLFNMLPGVSVLGIGLAEPYQSQRMIDRLIGSIGDGHSVGEIANELRAMSPNAQDFDGIEAIASRGVALFTQNPENHLYPE